MTNVRLIAMAMYFPVFSKIKSTVPALPNMLHSIIWRHEQLLPLNISEEKTGFDYGWYDRGDSEDEHNNLQS
jgi:hypothetical protein